MFEVFPIVLVRYILWNMSLCKGGTKSHAGELHLLPAGGAAWEAVPVHGIKPHHTTEDHTMKLSARNQLKGKIVDVVKGATTSHVRIDIGGGVIVTSSITNEAVADLGLKQGHEAWAVIKASDVMIGK
jgi:molybdopterin-binding protein